MVYTRVEANSTNIARSFFPRWDVNLFASLLEKTRGSIVDKCKRDGGMLGEINPGKYCAGSQHAERDIKHFLVFFSTRLLTEFLAKASKRVHPLGFSLPFAIHRFDTGRSLFQNTRYIPPPPPPLPLESTAENTARGQEVTQWRWPAYTPTIFPSASAISSLLYDSPLPFPRPLRAPRYSWQFYFLSARDAIPRF